MNEKAIGKPQKSLDESLEEWGGRLVVFGLLIEVVLAISFHGTEPWYEKWPLVAANVLIAIGVWIEIHFGGKARAEANARTAEANARAAEAELETERLKKQVGWRNLSAEQFEKLINGLRTERGVGVIISFVSGDVDGQRFAMQFSQAFRAAKWECRVEGGSYRRASR